MKFAATLSCLGIFALATVPAMAGITVNSPTNGEQVSSPFKLDMTASVCSSNPVTAVGYSLDSSSQTSTWKAQYIDGPVSAPGGWHTLHVKAWNDKGEVCVVDVSIDVVSDSGRQRRSVGGSFRRGRSRRYPDAERLAENP
jgi:hypothetical protein